MNFLDKSSFIICISLVIGLVLQACAGSGGMSGSAGTQEYSQDYNRMKEVVKQAIKAGNMNITFANESDSDDRITLIIGRERYMNNEEVQQEQGEVRIIKLDDENTRVEIVNPEYHFSVPNHQKEDYQRILFNRIDSILEKG